jgi:hypothetical protein
MRARAAAVFENIKKQMSNPKKKYYLEGWRLIETKVSTAHIEPLALWQCACGGALSPRDYEHLTGCAECEMFAFALSDALNEIEIALSRRHGVALVLRLEPGSVIREPRSGNHLCLGDSYHQVA